jgi:hypothetical protein
MYIKIILATFLVAAGFNLRRKKSIKSNLTYDLNCQPNNILLVMFKFCSINSRPSSISKASFL